VQCCVYASGLDDVNAKKFQLRNVEYLLGCTAKLKEIIVLGMIAQLKEVQYFNFISFVHVVRYPPLRVITP